MSIQAPDRNQALFFLIPIPCGEREDAVPNGLCPGLDYPRGFLFQGVADENY